LLYKTDVLSEDAILKWYKESHSSRGWSVFMDQVIKMSIKFFLFWARFEIWLGKISFLSWYQDIYHHQFTTKPTLLNKFHRQVYNIK
jgi:hypothetical protein